MVTNKWIVIALTASLAVNVFLAGMFAGRQLGGPRFLMRTGSVQQLPGWRPGDRALPPMIDRIADGMSPQNRTIFLSTMDEYRPEIVTTGAALRDARGKVREMLAAENLDRATTATAMADLQNRETQFRKILQSALLDAAAALPLDGRRQMVTPPRRTPPQ